MEEAITQIQECIEQYAGADTRKYLHIAITCLRKGDKQCALDALHAAQKCANNGLFGSPILKAAMAVYAV